MNPSQNRSFLPCHPANWFLLALFLFTGCLEAPPAKVEEPRENIMGQKTQDIGEFDPEANAVEANRQASANPLAAADTYGQLAGGLSQMEIQKALQIFEAINERYPNDHSEFIEQVIKKNNIWLPVLPGGDQYQYDVANHELKIVKSQK